MGARHQVNFLANDQRKIKKLIVPLSNQVVEHTYTIVITDEHLTQVIYTAKKRVALRGVHNHWLWNSCRLVQISADL